MYPKDRAIKRLLELEVSSQSEGQLLTLLKKVSAQNLINIFCSLNLPYFCHHLKKMPSEIYMIHESTCINHMGL